jgi:hypothetical protein
MAPDPAGGLDVGVGLGGVAVGVGEVPPPPPLQDAPLSVQLAGLPEPAPMKPKDALPPGAIVPL